MRAGASVYGCCPDVRVTALQDYRPRYWYFEVIEVLKTVLLSCLVVLFMPGTPSQLVLGVVITVVGAASKLKMRGFIHAGEDRCGPLLARALTTAECCAV